MTFKQLLSYMKPGETINFTEYTLDRHERKHVSIQIENGIIRDRFDAGEIINRDRLMEIYGEELDDQTYLELSVSMSPRFLISVGTDESGNDMVKMLTINEYFYDTGQQVVEVIGKTHAEAPKKPLPGEEPNYTEAMKAFDMF